jgi:hypothetical protein
MPNAIWSGIVMSGLVLALTTCTPATLRPDNPPAEDLRFVLNTVTRVHPMMGELSQRQRFEQQAEALMVQAKPDTSLIELYRLTSTLLSGLGDGHTWAMPPQSEANLPIRLNWVSDGLGVESTASPLVRAGDVIRSIGRLNLTQLLELLRTLVPAENDGHIRAFGGYLLPRASVLQALGLVNPSGTVSLELARADGSIAQVELPLSTQTPQSNSRPPFGWKIESNYGLFWLDTCDNTPEYQQALEGFFTAAKQANLRRIAIDVQRNSGGDSQVLNALLGYLPADSVQVFHKPENSAQQAIPHPKSDLVFKGEVYVLIGPFTFSSANWIAGTIQDNHLGKLVGESTGNAPTSYGNTARFTTPYLGLSFTVSKNQWVRPDPRHDPANALEPDTVIPTTLTDLRAGRDPVLAWLSNQP